MSIPNDYKGSLTPWPVTLTDTAGFRHPSIAIVEGMTA